MWFSSWRLRHTVWRFNKRIPRNIIESLYYGHTLSGPVPRLMDSPFRILYSAPFQLFILFLNCCISSITDVFDLMCCWAKWLFWNTLWTFPVASGCADFSCSTANHKIHACPSRGSWPAARSSLPGCGLLPMCPDCCSFSYSGNYTVIKDDQIQECKALVNEIPSLIKRRLLWSCPNRPETAYN